MLENTKMPKYYWDLAFYNACKFYNKGQLYIKVKTAENL